MTGAASQKDRQLGERKAAAYKSSRELKEQMRQPRNWHTGEPLADRKVPQPQVDDVDAASFEARDGAAQAAGAGKDSDVTRSSQRAMFKLDKRALVAAENNGISAGRDAPPQNHAQTD